MENPNSDYERMATAIEFIAANVDSQPGLAEVAAATSLSPHHFQRVFSRWVGISPKRFLQVLTVDRAKALLHQPMPQLEVACELGLSSSSRLHDHFVAIEAATPGEFGRGGEHLEISHGIHDSPFGRVFVAVTRRGICRLEFLAEAGNGTMGGIKSDETTEALAALQRTWPRAAHCRDDAQAALVVDELFGAAPGDSAGPISLHVAGTNFQISVWRALLAIPPGRIASYGQIAAAIGRPAAVRAVGTAVGANPAAYVIPCHRVIRNSGELGGYRWGVRRKRAMLSWEAAQIG